MNTRILTRLTVSLSLLISLVSCSDATQFAEKTLPGGALDSAKPGETPAPGSEIDIPDPSEVNNSTDPTGVNPGETTGDPNEGTGGSTNPGDNTGGTGGTGGTTNPPGDVFGACDQNQDYNIVAQLYKLPETTTRLPDFSTMNSLGDVCVSQLNIADRSFTQGFPGVSNIFEWFALDMRFKLTVTKAGNYQFFVNSDDGSILSINGAVVVDNDGTHSQQEKSGSTYLGVGVHDVQVRYYQGPRDRIALELFWKVPGSNSKVYVPKSAMARP